MGAGIAATLIRSGVSTTMVDVNQDILDSGSARARQLAAGRSKSTTGQADAAESARIASLLSTSTSRAPLADCNVVIEAVTENEAIKTGIFEALAGVLRDEAILASNTSTIPISRMARSWVHPERFAGMHFFHPAQRMELVEVIRGEQTERSDGDHACGSVQKAGENSDRGARLPRFPGHSRALPLPEPGARAAAGRCPHGRDRRRGRAVWHANRTDRTL